MGDSTANVKVEYNFLGRSGLKVSNICLGTLTFGTIEKGDETIIGNMFLANPRQLDEKASHEILDRYVELGGNFIDTSNKYSAGNSERIIGNWLQKQIRENIIIVTKVRWPSSANEVKSPNGYGLSRHMLIKACDDSLERLKTNYIDLYQQQYNLAERHSEWEEFMVCEQECSGVLPWSPLKGAVLTGKLKRNTEPDAKDSRAGYFANLAKDRYSPMNY